MCRENPDVQEEPRSSVGGLWLCETEPPARSGLSCVLLYAISLAPGEVGIDDGLVLESKEEIFEARAVGSDVSRIQCCAAACAVLVCCQQLLVPPTLLVPLAFKTCIQVLPSLVPPLMTLVCVVIADEQRMRVLHRPRRPH